MVIGIFIVWRYVKYKNRKLEKRAKPIPDHHSIKNIEEPWYTPDMAAIHCPHCDHLSWYPENRTSANCVSCDKGFHYTSKVYTK